MADLAHALGELVGLAGTAMEQATQALLQADLATAEQVISDYDRIAELTPEAEDKAFALLALQSPVAGDLRSIVSGIHIIGDVDRMGALARHVADMARRRHPKHALPEEVNGYFADMGRLAVSLGNAAREALENRDPARAARLSQEDEPMDNLHQCIFKQLSSEKWVHGVEAAVDVALLSRYYERFADHAVAVGERVIFLVTGRSAAEYNDLIDFPN
jgi:phosphate transport system protein